jgi:MFS family permease
VGVGREAVPDRESGFDAASIGLVAAAYAVVVPLLEVPSGILADRSSRSGLMIAAGAAAAASALTGGLSTGVGAYVVAAGFLGVFFALSSGTVDSIVYDLVLEETGTSAAYEHWVGRVLMVQGAALAASALAGGVLAGWFSPRVTYLATVPLALGSAIAFALRRAAPASCRRTCRPAPAPRHDLRDHDPRP